MSAETGDDALRIAGYGAYFTPLPPPNALSAKALAMALQAEAALVADEADAEQRARSAIEILVDAFLADRKGNRACFAIAHKLGRTLGRRYGCPLQLDAEAGTYTNACGILALHSRIALSPGGPAFAECSICGAGDFECDHVPGRIYDGKPCFRKIVDWHIEEVSLVRVPRDPRCYRVRRLTTVSEVEEARGRPLLPGERPVCEHCQDCYGVDGPSEEDLDPASWPDLPEEQP